MNLEEIKHILQLMEENHLVEFEYEEEGHRVKLRRYDGRGEITAPAFPVAPAYPVAAPAPVAVPAAPAAPAAPGRSDSLVEFKSPLVGTFYRAPKPDAEPFVQEGEEVNAEKVLCIIEAMKVMNEIKAEMTGVIREILVKNGQAVEYGEPLFLIEKK